MRRSYLTLLVALIVVLVLGACGGRDTVHDAARRDPFGGRDGGAGPVADGRDPRIIAGDKTFQKFCALCHGADARGYAADNAPSLVNETFLASATDEFLTESIRRGRPGTAMAGYTREIGGPLSDKEIAGIVGFLRSKGPAAVTLPPNPGKGDRGRGLAIYEKNCKTCHGDPKVRGEAPHLANPMFLTAASDEFMRHAIVHGRPGTKMEGFAGLLADAQIDDVIALVRSWAPAAVDPGTPPVVTEPPKDGPVVINPEGEHPSFTLREDRFVAADQVKAALDAKQRMIIVDARVASDFLVAHIPGSISVAHHEMKRLADLPNDGTWVIAYCACPHHASGVVVDELRKLGFKNTAVLDEGILVWQQRGYPIDRVPGAPVPVPHADPHAGHNHP